MSSKTPAQHTNNAASSDDNATTSSLTVVTADFATNNHHHQHEQPQTKRQKIEKIKTKSSTLTHTTTPTTPLAPDIADTGGETSTLCSSLSSSIHSIGDNNSTSSKQNSPSSSLRQLLGVQNLPARDVNGHGANNLPVNAEEMAKTCNASYNSSSASSCVSTSGCSSAASSSSCGEQSADEVDKVVVTQKHAAVSQLLPTSLCFPAAVVFSQQQPNSLEAQQEDMREFEESLTKQCLCGVAERTLRKPFQSHYSIDANGQKRIANLSEWPTNKLLQFLSNLQLLFDIYLKQNSKGFICARIMDVCDALIRNDHNLIDEIIVLAGYSNAYVQFLAGRVLASFLVIAKQEMDDDWLKKLVDNLFNFERLDHVAVQKIHFSLEIIKRIVEWKDIDLHPLEDEIADSQMVGNAGISTEQPGSGIASGSSSNALLGLDSTSAAVLSSHSYMHFQPQQPTLESNYFAVHFRDEYGNNAHDAAEAAASTSRHLMQNR